MPLSVDYSRYAEIFFDLDGVLLDTNAIKKQNIARATAFKGPDFCGKFVDYFTANNGVPRESKVARFFGPAEATDVLEEYAMLNATTLHQADLVPGVEQVLSEFAALSKPIHVFTGASEEEAITLLDAVGLLPIFAGVHGGPRTKKENYSRGTHRHPILMFGDSRSDYEFAVFGGFDFVFVSGFTMFEAWRSFFRRQTILGKIRDFNELSANTNTTPQKNND